jgi:anti-sigma B factor antagonist
MKISTRQREDITIIQPQGKITIGVGDVALREAVHQALDGGAKKILLDLGSVTTVDSSGIGEMVSAFTTVTNRGGQLKLLNLPPKVTDILQITQLITVFDVHEAEDDAVEAFA